VQKILYKLHINFSARVLIRHGKVPAEGTRQVQVLHLAVQFSSFTFELELYPQGQHGVSESIGNAVFHRTTTVPSNSLNLSVAQR
jgi:hypothetical protein